MRIKYFQDTDTLYIEFRATKVAETKDLDENTLLDLDKDGNIESVATLPGSRVPVPIVV
jgi:uncharacterized protein YuzE